MINYIKALRIAFVAHRGQYDKGGKPYIWHPINVSKGVKDKYAKVVALLHDVLEDSDKFTIEDFNFLNNEQKQSLLLLKHDKCVPYFDYIDNIKADKIAKEVKIQDLKQNMNLTRLKEITIKDIEREKKYIEALEKLMQI